MVGAQGFRHPDVFYVIDEVTFTAGAVQITGKSFHKFRSYAGSMEQFTGEENIHNCRIFRIRQGITN